MKRPPNLEQLAPCVIGGRQLNYMPGVIELARTLMQERRGFISVMHIYHDERCPAINGGNECTCNPRIEVSTHGGIVEASN